MRIRQGNDFIFLWTIVRNGIPEDLDNAKNIKLHFKKFNCIGEVKSFQIVDGNIVRVEVSPEWASSLGAYRLILSYEFEDSSYSDGDRKCVVDVLAFDIVAKTSEADDLTEVSKTTDIMIGFFGLSAYEVWLKDNPGSTKEDYYNWLRQPATDAAESIGELEQTIEGNEALRVTAEQGRSDAELLRVGAEGIRDANETDRINAEGIRDANETDRINAERDRADAEDLRNQAEVAREEAEELRQTNTNTAIQNAEEATTAANTAAGLANNAATAANTAAGDANDAAEAANTAAGLANNAATAANTAAGLADNARLAIQDDLALKANQADLAQLESEVSLFKEESNLKDAIQDSKIKNIESIISTMNPNQSAQVSVSGASPLSLPKNAANGGMSVKLEGLTEDVGGVITHFEPTGRVRSVGKNLLNAHMLNNGLIKDGFLDSEISDFNGSPAVLLKNLPSFDNRNIYLKGVVKQSTQYTFSFKVSFDKYAQLELYLVISFVYSDGTMSMSSVYPSLNNVKMTIISSIGKTVSHIQISRQYASVGDRVRIYDISLTEGATEIPYEPYRETSLYLTAPELRSNGAVKDEIRKGSNGYELVKRVGVGTSNGEIVTGGDFSDPTKWTVIGGTSIISDGTLKIIADAGIVSSATQYKTITAGKIYRYKIDVLSLTGTVYLFLGSALTRAIDTADSGKTISGFFLLSTGGTYIRLAKDLGSNISAEFDNFSIFEYNPTEGVAIAGGEVVFGNNIHYTLATPEIIPISYGGVLNSAENGTVYHEPVIADAGVYDTKMDILLTDYPIATIEEIIKHENGVDTYLNVASAVVASDGLSFTHPDLEDGDLVLFTYAFDKESTNGNITATFYDSNVVKIDTVTGKAYKIEDVVTNGVLTRTLTEV